jgi:NAD(P)-dependent dehydrogenase (short-subunit alcohol dehydrogenase family)
MSATLVVIDGVGGGIGAQIVERLRKEDLRGLSIVALGTNAVATQRMVNAGADRGASGENAVRVSIDLADYIIGPIGIVLPNAMMGEITPSIAEAVFNSRGRKLLLPLNQPHFEIVGMSQRNVNDLITDAILALKKMLQTAD